MISKQPTKWSQVVGQDRVIRVLHALLRSPQHMTRGYIFEGPYAVGKTSSAHLFARALMCKGSNPLGCGQCDSCLTAEESLDAHPDYQEVDAALFSKVAETRELIDTKLGVASLGKRLVVIFDEAHRLSPESWDVFLKPLDIPDTEVVFLFVTSEGHKIPGTISSRCPTLRFGKVDHESLTGMLMAAADDAGIVYRHDGLLALARFAQGRPRDAIKALSLVAALGEVTAETVEAAMNYDASVVAASVFEALVGKQLHEAIEKADELAQRIGPVKVIETLFSSFSQDTFTSKAFSSSFAPLKEMSSFFVKWSASHHLPADIMPLFIVELNEMRDELYRKPDEQQVRPSLITPTPARSTTRQVDADPILNAAQMRALLEGYR